jgi:hypothetical protein
VDCFGTITERRDGSAEFSDSTRFESVTLVSPYSGVSLTRLRHAHRSIVLDGRASVDNETCAIPRSSLGRSIILERMTTWLKATPLAVAIVAATGLPARAQTLPSEPIVFGGGRLTLGGDAAVSFAPQDPGFFNYTDYAHSALRMLRIDLTAALKADDHLSLLADVRSENIGSPRPYALYARIRPWTHRAFDIQIGRVPPTFGAFARRTYAADTFLIGYPLAYQYLTSLRPDAVPASADELLKMRGRGWLASYSIGNVTPSHGVPLVSAFTWDTGVQVHAATDRVEATASVTAGTLANPLFQDDNSGKQIAGRVAWQPVVGLILGTSAARGPFVSETAARGAVGGGNESRFTQTAWGADVEYSRDYYLVRFEAIVSDWTMPIVRPPTLDLPLRAVSTSIEGRYKIRPGLYAAARVDHLGFSDITGSTLTESWDAPVSRVEVGGGYSIQRNLVLKVSYQYDSRAGGRVHTLYLPAAQLLFWF